MRKYHKSFTIRHFECNSNGFLRPDLILKYLSEVAILHNEYTNISLNELNKKNLGWMIYKWQGEIYKYPYAGDKIRIETWISKLYKFYANREFYIYDKSNEIIAKISSLWILVDMNKRFPRRIPKELLDSHSLYNKMIYKEFKNIENKESNIYKVFNVRKFDIDYNGHVNNSIYYKWMLESIDNIPDNYELEKFYIKYKKEVLLNDSIKSYIFLEKEKDIISCYHKIEDSNKNITNSLGKTIWKLRRENNDI